MAKTSKITQMVPKEPSTESSGTDNDYGSGASASYKAGIESDRMRRKSENAETVEKIAQVSERAANNQSARNRSDVLFASQINSSGNQQSQLSADVDRSAKNQSDREDRAARAAESANNREAAMTGAKIAAATASEGNATAMRNASVAANTAEKGARTQAEASKLASMFAGTTKTNYWGG